jgi:hypothetical protein
LAVSRRIRIANTLRFSTDAFGLFQIVKLPQESQYLSFSPVLIINQGDAQAALSPWQWWQAPDNALSELMNVNHLITITKKEDASKEKGGSIAHLSLPFGVYSSWCVGWYNEQLGSIQYRIIPYQLSLTRYSCRWEDFLQENARWKLFQSPLILPMKVQRRAAASSFSNSLSHTTADQRFDCF